MQNYLYKPKKHLLRITVEGNLRIAVAPNSFQVFVLDDDLIFSAILNLLLSSFDNVTNGFCRGLKIS